MNYRNPKSEKRSPKELKPRLVLPDSLQRRLDSYALAAGAAGVAVLACAAPAEGAPVCKTVNLQISNTHTHAFNPAGQAFPPFQVVQTTFAYITTTSSTFNPRQWWNRGFLTPNSKGANLLLATNGYAANVPSGGSIGPAGKFGKGASYGLLFSYGKGSHFHKKFGGGTLKHHRGNLNFEQPNNFFGFQFTLSGQTHYGWVRVQATVKKTRSYNKLTSINVAEYGYEDNPNTAITAGSCATAESGEPRTEQVADRAQSPNAQPQTGDTLQPQPASLGTLALGSQGIPLWRRAR